MTWDDADVVSAHGRPWEAAVDAVVRSSKVAVLTAPANPPETLGKELLARGCRDRSVVVASRLGEPREHVSRTDLHGLAEGSFDPLSVVLVVAAEPRPPDGPSVSWGRDEATFEHRDGMITKSEVRSVVLGKLELPRRGVLWDVGAGSGSVGIEAATIAPELRVYAVERSAADAARVASNNAAAGVADRVEVVEAEAPSVFAALPDPDRVFVGGGGLDAVAAAWERLRPGGVLVATFVLLDRAVEAFALLGSMCQIHVDRAVAVGGSGFRLAPLNPVLICWGRR
jgi:precorrin-6Y C5,15-methyltransferase (decarboxylating)